MTSRPVPTLSNRSPAGSQPGDGGRITRRALPVQGARPLANLQPELWA